jgi:arginine/lysine/ornithine decarboxylase
LDERKPIDSMLKAYARKSRARFHMPGHKGKAKVLRAGGDITEIAGADNLHDPEGAIARSQGLYAAAAGAGHSFLLVNGGTAGVLAMLMHAGRCRKILIGRDCHRSAVSALVLSGAEPVWIGVPFDEGQGIQGCVLAEDAARCIDAHPDAAAILLTRPNYYGLCCDLEGISKTAHEKGMLVLADEAHGAHFPFHPGMPGSAGLLGADLWVQSTHKTLPALTQTAVLHTGANIDPGQVQSLLAMLQTSSPSYPLLASIENARAVMERDGRRFTERTLDLIDHFLDDIAGLKGIVPMDWQRIPGAAAKDPLRLVLDVSGRGLTGYEAARIISQKGIEAEMADMRRMVLICTASDSAQSFRRLKKALAELPIKNSAQVPEPPPALPERTMSPRDAFFSRTEWLPLADCAARPAAAPVGAYPPGTPSFVPGEIIDAAGLEHLLWEREQGAGLFGLKQGMARVVSRT